MRAQQSSVPFGCVIVLTAAVQKNTIGDTDDRKYTTLFKSASKVLPIELPSMEA
jgi:hypothetical protein